MSKVRCAVVGLGRIGSLLEDDRRREKPATHAGAIAAHGGCVLVGGCDTDPERREAFARRWRCPQVFEDVDEFLSATRPHILHVATPPETHLRIVRAAADAEVPVVVCEKPLAADLGEARIIASSAIADRCRVLTNHERRYSRDYIRVRDIVREQRYGPLFSVTGMLTIGRARSPYEMLLHDGTHMVDIIPFLAGAPLRFRHARLSEVGERGVLFIEADAGAVPVVLQVGAGRDHFVFELDLSFERGRVRVGNGTYEEWISRPSPYYEKMRSLRRRPVRRPRVTGYFRGMMEDAVRCARDPAACPVSGAADGLEALEFIERVNTSD